MRNGASVCAGGVATSCDKISRGGAVGTFADDGAAPLLGVCATVPAGSARAVMSAASAARPELAAPRGGGDNEGDGRQRVGAIMTRQQTQERRVAQTQQEGAAAEGLPAGLYVVATPLGNLGDITVRARSVLARVACIACEDTRVTRELLRLLDIAPPPPLRAVHGHNERAAAADVLARIHAGAAVAYVSDAGTPAISDPGARLVAAVRAAGFPTIPIPGVSAVTAALSVAGIEATAFAFLGFAPSAKGELARFVEGLAARVETSVFFEAPHRIEATLRALAAGLPAARRIVIARELTKRFETVSALGAGEIDAWLVANGERLRGEFVLVVAGDDAPRRPSALDARELLTELLAELPPARAVRVTARLTGEDREALYALAETLKAR